MPENLRLISLAPTQTEILCALGMRPNLAGVTEDCDFPESVKCVRKFGSWYSPEIKDIVAARPDMVFTFGSHQDEVRTVLEESGIRVYHSEPETISSSLESMRDIARLLDREDAGAKLTDLLETRLRRISEILGNAHGRRIPRVLRIMNWDPLIAPGPGAFQHDVIEFAGGRNVTRDGPASYFVCKPEEIRAKDPDIIFFCEPHIRKLLEQDAQWRNVSAVRDGRIFVYDCGLTCRSGPRIVDMAEELNRAVMQFATGA